MNTVSIVAITSRGGSLPEQATPGSSGYDLTNNDSSYSLAPGERRLFNTGVRIRIKTPNTEAQVRPRSGLAAKHGVTVLNAPGTIDADYTGEIKVLLINHGDQPVLIDHAQRIAQLVFAPVAFPIFIEWTDGEWTDAQTARGEGGFGSTGG